MVKTLVKVAVVLICLVIALLAWAGWLFFKRPLTVDAHLSRRTLAKAGLEQIRLQSGAGALTCWEGGEGPTLVLLHGAGDQAGAWSTIVPGLIRNHRLLIPDQPGHWKSEPVEGPIHVEQLLDGLRTVMDERCGEEPAVLVGNSMGAWMAMLYARETPARVDRIVAINGGALTGQNTEVNIFPTTREEARATMRALLGPNTPVPPAFVLDDVVRVSADGPAARFAATAADMGRWVLDGRLHEVTVPTELIWGDADELMPVTYARRMLRELPRGGLEILEDCGHVPQRECPDLVRGAIERALASPFPEQPTVSGESDS